VLPALLVAMRLAVLPKLAAEPHIASSGRCHSSIEWSSAGPDSRTIKVWCVVDWLGTSNCVRGSRWCCSCRLLLLSLLRVNERESVESSKQR